ncbi:ABC transporter permease [Paludibaculum fermentans]|uniref:ABC transporter permease n=1 Tax=Paludibaculum fermentans TaxID=1473598 RepID=UPI003EC07B6A
MWRGDLLYLVRNLVLKDFKVRYRNMSLGMLWSLLNPLVMMGILTFVFTMIFPNKTVDHFAVFVLTGMVPYNFFSLAWATSSASIVESADFIKRVNVPREMIPLTAVLSTALNMAAQVALLFALVLFFGYGVNRYWLLLPVVWGLEIAFVCGLGLITGTLAVFIRDTRYVVESVNLVMFWLVPIFYPFSAIPPQFQEYYQLNPVAALVLASRNILLEGVPPSGVLLTKLALVSFGTLAVGSLTFRHWKRQFYDYL